MENNVIVSVIIPAYNVCGYIKECLESCKRQNFNETEFIVINDGSTDGTKEEIEEFIKSDSRFHLIDKQNQGVTAAREDGLKVAKGKYVFFLDGDDKIESPDILMQLCSNALANDSDFVRGDFNVLYSDNVKHLHKFPEHGMQNSIEALKYAFLNNDFYYTSRLIRKSLVEEIRNLIPHDITYGEDTYAVVNILAKIRRATKINIPIIDYVQRANSVTNRLTKYDLEKRNKATVLTLDLAYKMNLSSEAQNEINTYALRELYQSIALNVPNVWLYKKYRGKCFDVMAVKRNLPKKYCVILFVAALNLQLTCKIIKFIKHIK